MAQPLVSPRLEREQSNPIADSLDRLIARLDMLARDARLGHPIPRDYERQADEAHAIAAGLRETYRAPLGRRVYPTAYHAGLGYGG